MLACGVMRQPYSNPNWRYQASCVYCTEPVTGSEAEVRVWMNTTVCMGAREPGGGHVGNPHAVYISFDTFHCDGCQQDYGRIVGGFATETMCDSCVAKNRTPKPVKQTTFRALACGAKVAFSRRDSVALCFSHARYKFFLGGENWSCCIPTSSYNPLDGTEVQVCGKRATVHLTLPHGMLLPDSADKSACGMVCARHGAQLGTIRGANAVPIRS